MGCRDGSFEHQRAWRRSMSVLLMHHEAHEAALQQGRLAWRRSMRSTPQEHPASRGMEMAWMTSSATSSAKAAE